MKLLYFDVETFSEVDVKKTGAYVYAAHPSTEVICMAYAYDNDPIYLWDMYDQGDEFPDIQSHLEHGGKLVAHNIEFEREIIWQVFGIDTKIDDWIDTAAIARYQALPGGLDELCLFYGYRKHEAGHKAMLKLCKPRKPSKLNPLTRWTPETAPNDFEALYIYCKWDVEIMRRNLAQLRPMTQFEREVWALTIEMNERGLKIDTSVIPAIKEVLAAKTDEVQAKVVALTGGIKTTQTAKLTEFCGLPNLQKSTVVKALKPEPEGMPEGVKKQVLQYRFTINKASLKKIPAIEKMLCADARVRGTMVYAGATRTRRWSGAGIQPQNFPRGLNKEKLESVFERLNSPNPIDHFEDLHNEIADSLKGLIIPPNGGPWIIADYSQIEVRVLAWFAGCDELITAFEAGRDVYKEMASNHVYKIPVEEVEPNQRFACKQLILGCGYGLGGAKFHTMLRDSYGVFIDPDECDWLVKLYRSAYSEIPQFWYKTERAFRGAIAGRTLKYRGLMFAPDGEDSVAVTLPSGGVLYYNRVIVDDDGKITYFGKNQYTHKLEQVQTYYGRLVENIVQATSRDIMAEAMLRIDSAGDPIFLTVHDEIVAELLGSESRFIDLMTRRPTWGPDIPLAVEYVVANRYQKG